MRISRTFTSFRMRRSLLSGAVQTTYNTCGLATAIFSQYRRAEMKKPTNKRPAKRNPNLREQLRAFGLGFPGAHTKSPWPGHDDLAVNDKTFVYLSAEGEP